MSETSIKSTANPQWVYVKEGKHKGKTLRFVKNTEKRVGVQDESSLSSGKIIYLLPEHVKLCTRGDRTISNNERPRPVSPGAEDVVPADTTWVRIIAGKHRGKTLRYIKHTEQRVVVELEDGKIIYLLPDHIQLENEEISIITTQPLRDAIPLPVSPSSEPSTNMDDDESSYDFVSAVTTLSEKNDNNEEKDESVSTVSEKSDDNEVKDESVSTEGVGRENLDSLTIGDKIIIRRGAHEGKTAIFVKHTGKRVAIKLEGETTIRYLCPGSLEPNTPTISREDETNPMVLALATLSENDNDNEDDDTPVSTVGVVHKNSNSLITGDKITIRGGVHAGKTANFVKCTEKRVAIKLEGETKIRYLCPGSLERNTCTMSPEDENDPMVQAIRLCLPNNCTSVKNVTHFLLERTLFGVILGKHNPVFFDIKTASISKLPHTFIRQDQTFHLSCVKLHDKAKSLICTYIPARSDQHVMNHLLQIGAFDDLTPHKTCARLELLLSTAARGAHIISRLHPSDFCIIPERGNVGCGFVPRRTIDLIMGTPSPRVCALQVRIAIPSMGIFKGMLMEKSGIETIQLPPSMKKVDAARAPDATAAWVLINKTGIYPYAARVRQAENSFRDERAIPEQARWMLMQKGASRTYLREPNGRFSSLVGVADPTDSIPPGCVFVSGICDDCLGDEFREEVVLISRFPMTEALDGRVLPIVRRTKPPSTSMDDWELLRSLPFGLVIFGNPAPGDRPMPEQIAQGDLDGDDYFVTWDRTIIREAVIGGDAIFARKNPSGSPPPGGRWWAASQEYMSNIEERKESNLLFSCLHGRWLNKLQNGSQDDAVFFGRAYKESLAAAKHGRKVSLPTRLWAQIPRGLHRFLRPPLREQ